MTKPEITWQDAAGRAWVEMQERTDAQLDPFGRAALARVAPARGERALDVGCGAGQTTLQLAELVGPEGTVVGVDISGPLLGRARERAAAAGHANIQLVLGDAATADLAPPFDLVFSRFGTMFFDDPVAAFAHLRRAMRSGGRLGFVAWQAMASNPWADAPLGAVRAIAPAQEPPAMMQPGKPGPFAFAEASLVRDILTGAGFADVEVAAHDTEFLFGAARTLDDAVAYALQIGPAARFIAAADPALAPRMTDAVREALRPYAGPGGVAIPARAWLVTARAP